MISRRCVLHISLHIKETQNYWQKSSLGHKICQPPITKLEIKQIFHVNKFKIQVHPSVHAIPKHALSQSHCWKQKKLTYGSACGFRKFQLWANTVFQGGCQLICLLIKPARYQHGNIGELTQWVGRSHTVHSKSPPPHNRGILKLVVKAHPGFRTVNRSEYVGYAGTHLLDGCIVLYGRSSISVLGEDCACALMAHEGTVRSPLVSGRSPRQLRLLYPGGGPRWQRQHQQEAVKKRQIAFYGRRYGDDTEKEQWPPSSRSRRSLATLSGSARTYRNGKPPNSESELLYHSWASHIGGVLGKG